MKKLSILFLLLSTVYVVQAQSKVQSTKSIIKEACAEAGKQNKNAFIIFHASWCVWCHKLDSSLNDPSCKKFFDDNYVIKHVTAFEVKDKTKLNNPGAEEFLKKHKAIDQGIPAWFIFDKDGNLLNDSQLRQPGSSSNSEGANVGCPANTPEIDYFVSVLKNTSKNLTTEQENAIRQRFSKNHASE